MEKQLFEVCLLCCRQSSPSHSSLSQSRLHELTFGPAAVRLCSSSASSPALPPPFLFLFTTFSLRRSAPRVPAVWGFPSASGLIAGGRAGGLLGPSLLSAEGPSAAVEKQARETGGKRQTISGSLFWLRADVVQGKSTLNHSPHRPYLLAELGDLCDCKGHWHTYNPSTVKTVVVCFDCGFE